MTAGSFQIGNNLWTPANGSMQIEYGAEADILEVAADGIDDARDTFRGRKVREINVSLQWKEDRDPVTGGRGPIDTAAMAFLKKISPSGPSAGKPAQWTEDNADIFNVNQVIVRKIALTRTPGVGSASAKLTLRSWVKPAVRPAVTVTPTTPNPWSPQGAPQPTAPPTGFVATPVTVEP